MSELFFVLLVFLLFLTVLSVIYNNVVSVRKYKITLPGNTSRKRVVFLADVFSNTNRRRIAGIIENVRKCNPDIIVVTGPAAIEDNLHLAQDMLGQLSDIATVFCTSDLPFDSDCIRLEKNDAKIYTDYSIMNFAEAGEAGDTLDSFSRLENIKILVCNNCADIRGAESKDGIDLVLCHRNGFTVRMPFYGALYCSGEGFFPKYPDRFYKLAGNNNLIITTGAGKTKFYIRLTVFREIPCVDFE